MSVLIGERKFPNKEMCHLGWDKLKRKTCHLKRDGGSIKPIYKSRAHIPLIFSTHFSLHFLKPVLGQSESNYPGRREYNFKIEKILVSRKESDINK